MPGFEVIDQEEFMEVKDVFDSGGILFRNGFDNQRQGSYKVKEFEESFARNMGSDYSLAVSSGTAALRVALAALGIGEGDEVITQCFTFVATVEAIIEAKAIPICTNIDSTLNLDPDELESRITPKTKAVIVVHMLGTPSRLQEIQRICKRRNLFLIEDTAWGCGGSLLGKKLGTWGDIGTFSFDFAKTITTGEGGMLVFKSEEIYKKAAAWHDHGHENNPDFPRWEDTRSGSGFNFRMMELQGAVGIIQLRKLSNIIEAQRRNKAQIWEAIKTFPNVEPRSVPDGSYETADALIFMVENKKIAKQCRQELLNRGLSTKILPEAYTWHFAGTWDHMPSLKAANGKNLMETFKISNQLLARAVSLPVSVHQEDSTVQKIISAIKTATTK